MTPDALLCAAVVVWLGWGAVLIGGEVLGRWVFGGWHE